MHLEKQDIQVNELIDFIRYPDSNRLHGLRLNDRHLCFTLSHLGRLFVKEYRILSILSQKVILLSRNYYNNLRQNDYFLFRIQPRNRFRNDKEYRVRTYNKLLDIIRAFPFKGNFRSRNFSVLTVADLESTMTPIIHETKNMKFYEDSTIKYKQKNIDCKQAGTLLHSLMEFYIAGNGWVSNQRLIREIYSNNLQYKPLFAIHTVNYIIGLELVKGGYEVISTEKLLEITNLIGNDYTNFNRLDLVLRSKDKVLVIDWKFSGEKACDYMKGYKHKVQKYLTLVKKYYRCEVEFHLYCIHMKDNGFMCDFSTETIHKRISNIEIKGPSNDDDMWVVGSEEVNGQAGQNREMNETIIMEQEEDMEEGENRKQSREMVCEEETKQRVCIRHVSVRGEKEIEEIIGIEEVRGIEQTSEVMFQLSEEQLEQFCTDDYLRKHIDEWIEKEQIDNQQDLGGENEYAKQSLIQEAGLIHSGGKYMDQMDHHVENKISAVQYPPHLNESCPKDMKAVQQHSEHYKYPEPSVPQQQQQQQNQQQKNQPQPQPQLLPQLQPQQRVQQEQILMITEQTFKKTAAINKRQRYPIPHSQIISLQPMSKEMRLNQIQIGIGSIHLSQDPKRKSKVNNNNKLIIDLEEQILIQID